MSATTRHLTILLTDIKGFTSKTSSGSRDDIKRLLEDYKGAVLPVLQAKGGRLVKTIGDAYLMVYQSPTDAVLAGVAAQDALAALNRGRPAEQRIDIRVVVNAGEVNLVGGDVFGEPVNITARMEELAEAGEVYFTESVYLSMIKAEVPSQELGYVELKGIPEKVRLYKVRRAPRPAAPPEAAGAGDTARLPPELRLPPDPLVGTTVGPCRIEALVGKGGMGAVYRAQHLTLERPVALKLLAAAGEQARAAALAEARAAAKLDDPRIVAIHEVGEDAGRPYIVMQWVEGETLEARVARSGPLPPAQALAVMKETLAALAVAHEAGIVHRDVKPGNIMLTAKGGVKLADFGLAVRSGGGTEGDPAGTFLFMAPEQGYGQAADARADLYAVGGTWYYALTGKPPFGVNPSEAVMRHRDEAPPDPSELREDVTRKNAELIRRLLAKEPGQRPASAAETLKLCSSDGFLVVTSSLGESPFALKAPPPKPRAPEPPPPPPAPTPAPGAPARVPAGAGSVVPGGAREPIGPPVARAMPAPPPPPPPAAAGGSRVIFAAILAVFVLAALGGSFRKSGPADWIAASFYLSALLGCLTLGDRLKPWRKAAGAAAWLGSLACAAMFAGPRASSVESMALAGLGAACGAAALYLGLWGQDREEALYARGLAPLAGLMLAASAVTWGAPDPPSWTQVLALRGRETFAVFHASGGSWRWLGACVLTAALAIIGKMKAPPAAAPTDRKLNWNR